MSVIAITGVSGYIGQSVAEQFECDESIEKIVGIDIRPPERSFEKLEFHEHSVTEPFGDIFEEHGVDLALHLAFILDPIHDKSRMKRVNVGGTQNFLAACEAAETEVVCVLSSATAYGAHPDNPSTIFEGSPLRAEKSFPYAYHKVLQERACYEWVKDHPETCLIIARPVVVMGPNVDNFIARIFKKNVLLAVKGHNPPLQFIHEDDLVRVIQKLMKMRRAGIYNIGGDGTVRLSEIAHLMKKRLVFLPPFFARLMMALGWIFRITSITEAPPGVLPYMMHPWVVQNSKVKHEILYSFRYSSKGAVIDFIDSLDEV